MTVGEADNGGGVVALPAGFDRQQSSYRNREGRCQQEGSAGDTPVEKGRTDRDMPGPAGISHIAKRGEAGEHIVAPYPLTDKKGRRGATEPEDTHDPEASCHGVEGEIGRFG